MKKVLLLVLILVIPFGVCGCMKNNKASNVENGILDYLQSKYNKSFAYKSEGDDVWSSKTISYIYSDQEGHDFTVENTDGSFSDNYYSVLFDSNIQEYYNSNSSTDSKLYVNTQSVFSNKNKSYTNWNQYFDDCSIINIAIYTKSNADFDVIANDVLSCSKTTVSAVIYIVAEEEFENVSQNNNGNNALRSGSFWIENGVITSTSWEE